MYVLSVLGRRLIDCFIQKKTGIIFLGQMSIMSLG